MLDAQNEFFYGGNPAITQAARQATAGARTEREKAKALYDWLCENISYDGKTMGLTGPARPDQRAPAVFERRDGVCEGYSRLFVAMAGAVDLDARSISGYSKNYTFEFDPKSLHAWNVVSVDGRWELLDCTWGAGSLDDSKKFIKGYDADWFLVRPENFLASHFPAVQSWQLLDQPQSIDEFVRTPNLHPRFFRYGLSFVKRLSGRIACSDSLEIPIRSKKVCTLRASVLDQNENTVPGVAFVSENDGHYLLQARFPKPGQYQISLLGKLAGEEWERVATIRIKARKGTEVLFPETYPSFYERQCRLLSPKTYSIGQATTLELAVPEAESVHLVVGKSWTEFVKTEKGFRLEFPVQSAAEIVAIFRDTQSPEVLLSYGPEEEQN